MQQKKDTTVSLNIDISRILIQKVSVRQIAYEIIFTGVGKANIEWTVCEIKHTKNGVSLICKTCYMDITAT